MGYLLRDRVSMDNKSFRRACNSLAIVFELLGSERVGWGLMKLLAVIAYQSIMCNHLKNSHFSTECKVRLSILKR